jgi:hypothetical protein
MDVIGKGFNRMSSSRAMYVHAVTAHFMIDKMIDNKERTVLTLYIKPAEIFAKNSDHE